MRAVAAVHVHGAVVDYGVAVARVCAGEVLDCHHACLRDIGVHVIGSAAAKAGVGNGSDLRAAIIAGMYWPPGRR